MSRILTVAKREYLENVRTKAFLIGVILTPLWMGLIFVIPLLIKDRDAERSVVVIADETDVLGDALERELETRERFDIERIDMDTLWSGFDETEAFQELRENAGKGDLHAVILTRAALTKDKPKAGEHPTEIFGPSSMAGLTTGRELQNIVDQLVNEQIILSKQIDPEAAALLQRSTVRYMGLKPDGAAGGEAHTMTPFIFMMLLFIGIMGISQMLLNSTLEEKSNRIYEVLLSSVSARQLMAGKIIGICAVGFTLLLLWSVGGWIAAASSGMGDLVSGKQVGLFFLYYLLGFLMIASLMVAIGSACNTLKEAQNLMAPISMLLAMPLILSMIILQSPHGTLATLLSFTPPFIPFVMMMRIASVPSAPAWQIVLSLVVLAICTYFAFRLAARVFRTGVLLYGQPASLKNIFKWMRAKDS